jgi:predicted PurR-regulated permease PerM
MPNSKPSSFITQYVQKVDALNQNIVTNLKQYIDNYAAFNVNNFGYKVNTRNLSSEGYEQANENKDAFLTAKRNLYFLDIEFKNLIQELNNLIREKNNSIDELKQDIEELTDENNQLSKQAQSLEDSGLAAKPFFEDERIIYSRSIIFLISMLVGIVFILYLLRSTPFTEIATNVATKSKDLAKNAKNAVQADMQNPDNSNAKNIIIFLLVSIVIIAVFYFIVYLIRRARPTAEETETQKKIKQIAQSCQRDKSESWISSQIDNIKGYLLDTNTRRPDPSLPGV